METLTAFTNYNDFIKGLACSLSSEFFDTEFPEYENEISTIDDDDDVDVLYVKKFLREGLNPQEGLEKLVDMLLDNHRYAHEIDIENLTSPFFDAGASLGPLTRKLFYIPNLDRFEHTLDGLEDVIEESGVEIRGLIMKQLPYSLDKDVIREIVPTRVWNSALPIDWESALFDEGAPMNARELFVCNYKYYLRHLNL